MLDEQLPQIVSAIIREYNPEKIILFGSLATGTTGEWSDIDLLVIKETDQKFFDRLNEIARKCDNQVGMDCLVYTPREYEQESAENPFFREEIVKKGRVIYEKQEISRLD
ncbi:nucleotidyltransferase domain-containing protein [Candidatus Poribacteria bacterium]|nr:nucleotidyltransferase domain-containing protein [Candidatus Poribacteria bacterium]